MDCGILEVDFWNMTFAELNRSINSWQRVQKTKSQEKAAYDYLQACLIGRTVASYFSDISTPTLEEAYGHLFQEYKEEKSVEQENAKIELSALRFKLFANAHNDKFHTS